MDETSPKIRLYVEADLAPAGAGAFSGGQAHYLRTVMRLVPGAAVRLFNGRDGEWRGRVIELSKKGGGFEAEALLRPQRPEPDLWLLFAPVKRAPLDLLVQKATELGVASLQPVLTRYTAVDRVNAERLQAIAVEAAEQCERLSVPAVAPAVPLDRALDHWPAGRPLLFCDERGGTPLPGRLAAPGQAPRAAILTGPEGGFETRERAWLRDLPFAEPVSLGPRTLRAETAAIAALVLWQSLAGDWRDGAPD